MPKPPIIAIPVSSILAGGSLPGSRAAAVHPFTIRLTEYKLTPDHIGLQASTDQFVGVNGGAISHALELRGSGADAHTPNFSHRPGQSETFTVTLKPGTYQLFCPGDGHRALGMEATVIAH